MAIEYCLLPVQPKTVAEAMQAGNSRRGNDEEREDAPSSDEEGIDLMNSEGDSSEEEDEDPEEEARIREGFIADDDDEDAARERKRRRRKKRKQREREFEALSEDDLDLVEQNTGVRIERPEGRKLKKLKRAGAASDEDEDEEEDRVPDIANLFDDIGARARKDKGKKRAAADDLPDGLDEDDMADFIEEDSPDEGEERDKEARLARKMKEKERRRKRATGLAMGGLDIGTEAWDEIQEIFGDGHDYDEALESDEEDGGKPAKRMQDVFEPSEIAERMMTDADDIIRALDIPERMQIAQAGLQSRPPPPAPEAVDGQPAHETEASDTLLYLHELPDAATWVSMRISTTLSNLYILTPNGDIPPLREAFITAVQQVLHFLCVEYFEVPFIWSHRRDYLVIRPAGETTYTNLLFRDDLWRIYHLAIKYRAILDRKAQITKLWQKLGEESEYYSDLYNGIQSSDEAADLVDYITLKYQKRLKEMAHQGGAELALDDAEVDAVRSGIAGQKYKRATSDSAYAKAKDSVVSRFAEQIAITAEQLAQGIEAGSKQADIPDPDSMPDQLADEYTDPAGLFPFADNVIAGAKTILINEIAKEPSIRKVVRTMFRNFGGVSVKPTEKGSQKIDELHPYYTFKYLLNKPVDQLAPRSAQFLQILAAENEGLVTVDIHIQRDSLRALTQDFYTAYLSDSTTETARAWNKVREDIVVEALQNHLLPLGARWTKDWLKETGEDHVCAKASAKLEQRLDVAPYMPKLPNGEYAKDRKKGDIPRVLAISAGRGNGREDWIHTVTLSAEGRFLNRTRLKEIRFEAGKTELAEVIEQHKPDVIVVGGFTPATHKIKEHVELTLMTTMKEHFRNEQDFEESDKPRPPPVVYCHDDTARLFQNSKRAAADFVDLNIIERYCLGLARYVQDPLVEYAALGDDLIALAFDPNQRLVPKDKLLIALQSAIVNFVNIVGVDINRVMRDDYYSVLLPFVAGLGARKASGMIRRIKAVCESTLVCRADLVKKNVCTSRIFMNCVAFLKIPQMQDLEENEDYDVLDSTRIHSEDYHIARKMAADAEEMDEEDTEDLAHPSGAVVQLLENGANKLDELSLDDFAAALQESQGLLKRTTLYNIRRELQDPYGEQRADFEQPIAPEIFAMLSGESSKTLSPGLVIPVVVVRVVTDREGATKTVVCRTDSGFEAETGEYIDGDAQYRVGQMLQAQVTALNMDQLLKRPTDPAASFETGSRPKFTPLVEISLRRQDIAQSNVNILKYHPDSHYDITQAELDKAADEAKNKRAQGRHRRVINHLAFHNFNAGQAEQYLANQRRGDCVVRPSSRGTDHLAITWKVDDGLYQHVDVLELDTQNEFSLGRSLRIQGKYTYADIDEMLTTYVRGMARKVEEMMQSEKYKGSEGELRRWLNTSIMAEPTRSFYGFAIDSRKPGNFILAFLTKGYDIQSWSVTVEPDQFILQGNSDPAPNVTMLCNAFKSTYITKMALAGGQAAGLAARTPYVGGRTPAAYQTGMTPYSARSPYVASGQQQPGRPAGGAQMHPSRMAQLQAGGYGR